MPQHPVPRLFCAVRPGRSGSVAAVKIGMVPDAQRGMIREGDPTGS